MRSLQSFKPDFYPTEQIYPIPVPQTVEILLCELELDTLYGYILYGSGPGDTANQPTIQDKGMFWTAPVKPPAPPQPVVLNITTTYINVLVAPVSAEAIKGQSPLTAYEILLEELIEGVRNVTAFEEIRSSLEFQIEGGGDITGVTYIRPRRSAPVPCNDSGFYIMEDYLPGDMQTETVFVIGKNEDGGARLNFVIKENRMYMICIGAMRRLDKVTRRSFSCLDFPVFSSNDTALLAVPIRTTDSKASLVAGVVVATLLVILLVIAVLFYLYVKRKNEESKHIVYADIASYHHGPTLADQYFSNRNNSNSELYHSCDPIDVLSSGPEIRIKQRADPDNYYIIKKSRPIAIKELQQYASLNDEIDYTLADEFRHLPDKFVDAVHVASQPQNNIYNRAAEVIPYDKNRVKLTRSSASGHTYINASFVQSIERHNYIVTQAPLSVTIADFWKMVWEQEVGTVVMLMELVEPQKPQCEQYWPDRASTTTYGDIRVSISNQEYTSHYRIRDLKLTHSEDGEQREVTHYQFISWGRGGLPVHPIPYMDFVRRIQEERDRSMATLVHCHAGGGRSGVYIACDSLQGQGKQTSKVDVLRCVTRLRLERPNLVKTYKQYCFVHESLAAAFDHPESRISGERFQFAFDNLLNVRTPQRMSILAREYEDLRIHRLRLQKKWSNNGSAFADVSVFHSPKKNRGNTTESEVPASLQVELDQMDSDVTGKASEEDTTGRPVYLNTFKRKNAVMVTQYPSPDQIQDFWKLILQNDIRCILDVSAEGIPSARPLYCPEPTETVLHGQYTIQVRSQPNKPFETCTKKQFIVNPTAATPVTASTSTDQTSTMNTTTSPRAIDVFEWHGWPADKVVPAASTLLDVLRLVRQWALSQEGVGNLPVVLVMGCQVGRAALTCLAWGQCERLEEEWLVDVYSSTKYMHTVVPRGVSNLVCVHGCCTACGTDRF